MNQMNPIELISAAFIGLGLLFILLALFETLRTQLPQGTTPVIMQGEESPVVEVRDIEAEFEAFSTHQTGLEYETIYEVPTEHIRPGDLLRTVKIPVFVQTFKFREKAARQANAHA